MFLNCKEHTKKYNKQKEAKLIDEEIDRIIKELERKEKRKEKDFENNANINGVLLKDLWDKIKNGHKFRHSLPATTPFRLKANLGLQ